MKLQIKLIYKIKYMMEVELEFSMDVYGTMIKPAFSG